MIQNCFKKWDGDKMGMPRKGWSVIKCFLSPVTMQEAFDAIASSRIMLSLGSLLITIFSWISNFLVLFSINKIGSSRSSSLIKYLSNFFLNRTSVNSSMSISETAMRPLRMAWSYACALTEFLDSAALIRALVSKTKILRGLIQ